MRPDYLRSDLVPHRSVIRCSNIHRQQTGMTEA
jgi:hypothetical protein